MLCTVYNVHSNGETSVTSLESASPTEQSASVADEVHRYQPASVADEVHTYDRIYI